MIHLLFVQLRLCWHLKLEPPTFTSISIWVLKLGYALLSRPKEKSTDWVIILDESIVLGSAKLLVIYGFRLSSFTFESPLQLRDLTPLHIQSQTHWTGDKIETILSKLQRELGIIRYAVADHGAAIKKGLKLARIIHVYDLTHKIASILQAIYKDDPEFVEYTKQMAQMRTKLCLSTVAHIIPPNQRAKSRFLNLDILAQWGINVLNYLEQPTSEQNDNVREKLAWVQSKEVFIRELAQIQMAICQLENLLKTKGLSRETFSQCQDTLKNCKSGKALYFKEQCQTYLQEILALLPEEKNICCSSDIIESAFGKYKNYLSQNLMVGITPLALCLAAFTSSLTETEIIQALENTTIQDIKIWVNQNIGTTLLTKRRKIFRKNGANF